MLKFYRPVLITALVLTISIGFSSSSEAAPSAREKREWLLSFLKAEPANLHQTAQVRKLVESYRIGTTPAVLPLGAAPYPRFVLQSQVGSVYADLYEKEWNALISNPPLELLFDGFMDMIVSGTVPPSMRSAANKIGVRIAKRVVRGKSPFCKLDASDRINEPSTFQLLRLKTDVLNLISPCTYRIRIYNAAKRQLIEARNDPSIRETIRQAAAEKFPLEFKKGFLTQINDTLKDFPALVVQKFGGEMHPIWGANGGLIENIEGLAIRGDQQEINLGDFARGMRADLAASQALLGSTDPKDRGLAAGLFYAAVNRILLLTGGQAIEWDVQAQALVVIPEQVPAANATPDIRRAPTFGEERFGGWGFEKGSDVRASASGWDWEKYDPLSETAPTPFRLFATRFFVNAKGVAKLENPADAYQKSEDLAELIQAVSEFVTATKPGAPFAKFFGGADQFGDLLDPEKPMLFPEEGRLLAIAIVSGIAKNLLHPTLGHVLQTNTGIHLEFRDHATFDGVATTDVSTKGVARLLVAAADLHTAMKDDPLLETQPALRDFLPQLETLLQLGALGLGAATQDPDGRIRDFLHSSSTAGSLQSQIDAMNAMLKAYNITKIIPLQVRLATGWTSLLTQATPASVSVSNGYELLTLWRDSQPNLRANHSNLPWGEWDVRIRDFQSHLRTTLGL